jgi:hypothetical protein
MLGPVPCYCERGNKLSSYVNCGEILTACRSKAYEEGLSSIEILGWMDGGMNGWMV